MLFIYYLQRKQQIYCIYYCIYVVGTLSSVQADICVMWIMRVWV
jgi:hypothetical protein